MSGYVNQTFLILPPMSLRPNGHWPSLMRTLPYTQPSGRQRQLIEHCLKLSCTVFALLRALDKIVF